MGHERARAIAAAALGLLLVATACGGSDKEAELPPVLDNARNQVAAAEVARSIPDRTGATDAADAPDAPDELPSPDSSSFEGANRVVNLWVGPGGSTTEIDVWGRRTFTNGPILLAQGVPFGGASEYFAAPPSHDLVIVGAGAGPDGAELAGVFNAVEGEQLTTVFTNDDDLGAVTAPNLFERGTDRAPESPAAGTGLVVLFAANTQAFGDDLAAAIGGDSFYVGDGSSTCRTQRVETEGFQPDVLGGTQRIVLELPPGPALLSLHPAFSPAACDQPSVLNVTVDVVADAAAIVVVYSPDGTTLAALTLPVD